MIEIEGYVGQKKKDFVEDPWERVYRAKATGGILQAPVTGIEKDSGSPGLLVDLGSVTGLIPFSEVGPAPKDRPEALLGSVVAFKVVACDRESGRAYLSRAKALEEMGERTWQELLEDSKELLSLEEAAPPLREKASSGDPEARAELRALEARMRAAGPVRTCVARHAGPSGAVVDIGGITAFLPRKEMAHGGVLDPSKVVEPGECFDVRVIGIDAAEKRVTVSVSALLPDPWEKVPSKYPKGSLHVGRAAKRTPKGLVVELEPGVSAFASLEPVQEVREGRKVLVKVVSSDASKRKMFVRFLREVPGWNV